MNDIEKKHERWFIASRPARIVKHEYILIDYFDVLGNEIDGYEVNNLSHERKTSKRNIFNMSDTGIINELKGIDYLNKDVNPDDIYITNWGDLIELELEKNGYPICRIEKPMY